MADASVAHWPRRINDARRGKHSLWCAIQFPGTSTNSRTPGSNTSTRSMWLGMTGSHRLTGPKTLRHCAHSESDERAPWSTLVLGRVASPRRWRRYVARVVGVDPSEAMIAAMHEKGVEAVRAGFLSYEHDGQPPHAVFTRNALHHLPDFWKVAALQRIAQLLEPGGALLLRDIVYSFKPAEADAAVSSWLASAPGDETKGWTAEQLAEHLRDEHSTYSWLIEPMLGRAGFEAREPSLSPR